MLSSSRRPRRRFQCHVRSHHPPAQAFFSGLIGEVLADPQGFRERARAQATEIRTPAGIGGESTVVMFSSSGGPLSGDRAARLWSPDIAGTLEKLAALRNRGALTEEEFQAQKKKLLDS